MTERPRAIVHLDLDAFYASVEVLDHRELVDKPVVVGGRPEERGVVAAASYEARAYGVHSAMSMHRAMQLCPDLVIVPPRFDAYRRYSRQVMALLSQRTSLIEQISIDEAYADLTDEVTVWDEAIDVARSVQQQVGQEIGLSASLGVATNKLVAKIASDRDKPGGLTVVRPNEESSFLAPLPVRALWGVGRVTEGKLHEMGIVTIGDLARAPVRTLRERFGRNGEAMAAHAQGKDRRPVVTEREAKSISQEQTFSRDISALLSLKRHLWKMSQKVAVRLERAELAAGTVAIKLRYSDFSTLTRQMSLMIPTDEAEDIYRVALALLERAWEPGRPVRLLGVTGRQLVEPSGQLSLC